VHVYYDIIASLSSFAAQVLSAAHGVSSAPDSWGVKGSTAVIKGVSVGQKSGLAPRGEQLRLALTPDVNSPPGNKLLMGWLAAFIRTFVRTEPVHFK